MDKIHGWCAIVCRGTDAAGVRRLVDALSIRGLDARPMRASRLAPPGGGDAPRVAVCRLPSGTPATEMSCLSALEDRWPWVNRPSRVAFVHDKLATLGALARAGLPVPPTVCVSRDQEACLDGLTGDRFAVKPVHGAAGHGVTICSGRDRALRRARAFADLSGPVLIQPYLGEGIDHRLFVIDGAVVAAMQRVPDPRDGRGNTLYGARVENWDPPPADRELALAAAAVLGLEVAGVDLVETERSSLVLEANSCPGFSAIEACTGVDLAGLVADLTLSRAASR